MKANIRPKNSISGIISMPPDKSISHRALIFSAIGEGITEIKSLLISADTMATVRCLRQLGVRIDIENDYAVVHGVGLNGLSAPKDVLDCGNSATTMRLLAGLLAGQCFDAVLDGDESLRRRPMARVIQPLALMGASIVGLGSILPPLRVSGRPLHGMHYRMPLHSAQVRSAIQLASMYANSETTFCEHGMNLGRNHTDLMMEHKSNKISISGDVSSAAFFVVLGLLCAKEGLTITGVGLNPTRIGFLSVLTVMGGHIELRPMGMMNGEPFGDIFVKKSELKSIEITKHTLPLLIDEIPILAVAAAFAEGQSIIKGAAELRVKESDRIAAMTCGLSKLGVDISDIDEGMIIRGGRPLKGAILDSYGDHRVAMALAIAATAVVGNSIIQNSDCVDVSFPNFFEILTSL